jgi:pimeloyl-ACP methyl ester carboxylesterase
MSTHLTTQKLDAALAKYRGEIIPADALSVMDAETEALPGLRTSSVPKLLVWGEDDTFQLVEFAERFANEMPHTKLVRVPQLDTFLWRTTLEQ